MAAKETKRESGQTQEEGQKTSAKVASSRSRRLERDLEHVNREIYARNLELAQTNKTLALLGEIDDLVLDASDAVRALCTKLAQEVVSAGYPFAAILGHPSSERTHLTVFGWAVAGGKAPKSVVSIIKKLSLRSDNDWLRHGEPLRLVNVGSLTDAQIAHYCNSPIDVVAEARKALGLQAICCVKLNARRHNVGVMLVGFTDQGHDSLSEFEQGLFTRLSEALGIAIDHKMLLDDNERMLSQLELSNKRLKALDRTKDDFISMASHQLRTPLTSVKGYMSMVLDGDAGKLNNLQRKLLTQSFISSQRMVYLISDLLNISRLKTGKFIIQATSSNLAQVVQEEVDQLMATAKGRNLTLTYKKPKNFPALMFDETKIRQVVMNFIDNAVYYTPSGGHIVINLLDKPDVIEFTVVDDGIGVPKNEQHRLFAKFFRADNAKRARPDGTGLGLFMAKKVITTHGGTIIFESHEGKGSMFGFTFDKSKLQDTSVKTP